MLAQTVLIVEPNKKLVTPFSYLPDSYKIARLLTVEQALQKLVEVNPSMVFLSASFSTSKSLKLLEALKNFFKDNLVALIILVDLSHRVNFVPGTSWGGKIAVIDSFASKRELRSTLDRVLKIQ